MLEAKRPPEGDVELLDSEVETVGGPSNETSSSGPDSFECSCGTDGTALSSPPLLGGEFWTSPFDGGACLGTAVCFISS